jgi:hypothetical protein
VREERQQREDLQVRLAAIARATSRTPAREETLDLVEQQLTSLRDELLDPV